METLREMLARGPVPVERALELARELARAAADGRFRGEVLIRDDGTLEFGEGDAPPPDLRTLGLLFAEMVRGEITPLAPVIAGLLADEPHPGSARELAFLLEYAVPAAAGPPATVSRRGFIVGTAAVGAAAVVVALIRPWRHPPEPAPSLRQLTFRQGRITNARLSRDGSRVTFAAAWDGEPLSIYIDGQEVIPGADLLALSATGEMAIAHDGRLVRSAPGGGPPVLDDGVDGADFGPDGMATVKRGSVLELAGVKLLETDGGLASPRVAPDGTRVACTHRGDLLLVDRQRRVETVLVGWKSLTGLAWDPDGDGLWLSGRHTEARDAIHRVRPGGAPRSVVSTDGDLRLHDVASGPIALVTLETKELSTLYLMV